MNLRKDKVAQRIKEEISTILHDEIKDPRIGFTTITGVKLTDDLRFARVFYSVLGEEAKKKDAREGLESACKYIKRLLADRLDLRYMPEVVFQFDETIEYGMKIDKIFQKIEDEKTQKDEKEGGEDVPEK